MKNIHSLFLGMSILVILFIANILALHWSLFWIFPWLDLVLHTFGGFGVGLLCWGMLPQKIRLQEKFWYTLTAVLVIGFLWEIAEFTLEYFVIIRIPVDMIDTFSDLVCDILGGLLATTMLYQYASQKKMI